MRSLSAGTNHVLIGHRGGTSVSTLDFRPHDRHVIFHRGSDPSDTVYDHTRRRAWSHHLLYCDRSHPVHLWRVQDIFHVSLATCGSLDSELTRAQWRDWWVHWISMGSYEHYDRRWLGCRSSIWSGESSWSERVMYSVTSLICCSLIPCMSCQSVCHFPHR